MKITQALFNPRMLIVLLLGFSSGLPLLLATGSTLQAWMTDAHIDVKTVGLFSLVGLPYTFKFLWSPIFDRYIPPFLGRRRGWMLGTQLALALSIIALGFWTPASTPMVLAGLALVVSFFSASQDIVIDAYRREIVSEEELGIGSSLYVNGYRFAMLFSGAFALWLADHSSWKTVYFVMGLSMLVGILTTLFSPEPVQTDKPIRTMREAVVEPFKEFFSRDGALLILAFILLYKLGDAMAAALNTRLYLELHFTKTQIATIAKTFGLGATLGGAFLGGLVMVRLGIYRSLWIFGILQNASIVGFSFLAAASGPTLVFLTAVIAIENFTAGMGTTAYSAYMASLTNRKFTATQYALLSSLMGVPRVILSSSSGYLVSAMGWVWYFIFCIIIAVPGLLLLIPLRPKPAQI